MQWIPGVGGQPCPVLVVTPYLMHVGVVTPYQVIMHTSSLSGQMCTL